MSESPKFRRGPRRHVTPPATVFEVYGPPQAPAPLSTSIVMLVMPIAGSLIIGIVIAVAMNRASYALLSLPMMLMSGMTMLYGYQRERTRYREQTALREVNYRAYLDEQRRLLGDLAETQRTASIVPNPAPQECRRRAESADDRLWERLPAHHDFLDVRVGSGSVPALYVVKPPAPPHGTLDLDPLLRDAQAISGGFTTVADCAVTLRIGDAGSVGVRGERPAVRALINAVLVQLATHHGPDELKLVLVFPESEAADWQWARWLPHTWSSDRQRRYVAGDHRSTLRLLDDLSDELRRRHLGRVSGGGENAPPPLPIFVCVFADPSTFEGPDAARLGPVLQLLRTQPRQVGAYSFFLYGYGERAGAVLDLTGGASRLEVIGPPRREAVFQADGVSTADAEQFARALAPLRPDGVSANAIPARVSLTELFGVDRVEELAVAARWKASEPFRSLAVPIGIRAGGEPLYLDIHEKGHGPHGLAAGATGAGKSELLQTLIAALAINFDPTELTFVLIDYKGGGMSNVFRELPHQIGIITNLEGNLAMRALIALRAENRRRQRLFEQVNVTSLDAYQRLRRDGKPLEPLPHVVIIADEFAELKQTQPEFLTELVSTVRIGRSLGMHLLLATQKPAGVVTDQILGNTRYRLCLRVAQPEDSRDMLRVPDAAAIREPGRAFCQVGLNEVFELFQSAFSGAPYQPAGGRAEAPPDRISIVAVDGTRQPVWPRAAATAGKGPDVPTQLAAVVAHVRETAKSISLPRLNVLWLPPLGDDIVLADCRKARAGWTGTGWDASGQWLTPIIGIVDVPAEQAQRPLALPIGKDGHLAVYGSPGSGKTTLLRTLIVSAALNHSPADLNIYILDFGSRVLKSFEALPHVGAVIIPEETERMQRLFRALLREMDVRKSVLAGAGTHAAHREQHGAESPPAILLVIDNYSEFAAAQPEHSDTVVKLAREGGTLGVHLIVTSTSVTGIPMRVTSSIGMTIALEMNEPSDYANLVGRTHGLTPARGVRGRGLIRAAPPLEFQTALPAPGTTDLVRGERISELCAAMRTAWHGPRPPEIRRLPERLPLRELVEGPSLTTPGPTVSRPIAVDAEMLAPFSLDLSAGPNFLVTGPPESGKTTLLYAIVFGLAAAHPPERLRLYLLASGGSSLFALSALPHVAAAPADDEALAEMVESLRIELEARRVVRENLRRERMADFDAAGWLASQPVLVVVIDDYDTFRSATTDAKRSALESVLRRARGLGLYAVVAGPTTEFTSTWDPVSKLVKESQTGFVLGTNDMTELNILNLRAPAGESGKPLPAGRGYYSRRGRARLIHVGAYDEGDALARWVERLRSPASEVP